jgi:predicted SAM-dependent methyltransferase
MKKVKIEIGAGNRPRKGFENFEHKITGKNSYDMITDELPLPDGTIDELYMSHVIEHCPMYIIGDVMGKLYKKVKKGGKIRVITPDLKQWVKFYLEGDLEKVRKVHKSFNGLERYGLSAAFTVVFCSVGNDMYLFDRKKEKEIIGIAHCAAYDFESLSAVLKEAGFINIERSDYDENIESHFTPYSLYINAEKEE